MRKCPNDTAIFQLAKARSYIGTGFCPGGTSYMIKKILAAGGDSIETSAEGIYVNGRLLPNSKPMDKDSAGRSLTSFNASIMTLNDQSVLLMSDYSPKSFDARYFGLIDKSQIISAIKPVWTW